MALNAKEVYTGINLYKITIMSQKIEFYGGYGRTERSSAIFYFCKDENLTTLITFLNYWLVKRDLRVRGKVTYRDMEGKFDSEEIISFEDSYVLNFNGNHIKESFEGSIEIEIFCDQDLVIPYAAIMAIYSTKDTISMTHSYGRTYSKREVEEGRTICEGNEGCWVLRDKDDIRSFCIFHNGDKVMRNIHVSLEVKNYNGDVRNTSIVLDKLNPYQTKKLYPSDYIHDLKQFLNNKDGSATITYQLGNSFTRMLIGNETIDKTQIQTAHSNFNYAIKDPGNFSDQNSMAMMLLPDFGMKGQKVIIYPDYANGEYELTTSDKKLYLNQKLRKLEFVDCKDDMLEISCIDKQTPNRFVTGYIADYSEGKVLPLEVSRGIRSIKEPAKRFWWGPCTSNEYRKSKIFITAYRDLCELIPEECTCTFKFYNSFNNDILTRDFKNVPVLSLGKGMTPDDLYGASLKGFFNNQIGYFSFYSEFYSFDILSLIGGENDSLSLEHCF